jgi:hypothetical protein
MLSVSMGGYRLAAHREVGSTPEGLLLGQGRAKTFCSQQKLYDYTPVGIKVATK